jgi:hypothetical protein
MITDPQQRDLVDLRHAAQTRDPQQVQFLTKKLLGTLDFYVALAVTIERVYAFMDIFESYYPDEIWARKTLVSMVSFGVAPDDQVAEMALGQTFSAPGCANFIKAFYDVCQCMQKKHTAEARIGFMTSAIVNVIMAELVEAWYGEREDLWQIVRADQTSDQAIAIAYSFWMDEDTVTLDKACWQEVADSIEAKLNR